MVANIRKDLEENDLIEPSKRLSTSEIILEVELENTNRELEMHKKTEQYIRKNYSFRIKS